MENKPRIIIVGKLPPPYFGPAIATKIILNSSLNDHFDITHFNNKLNEKQGDIGKWSLKKSFAGINQWFSLYSMLRKVKPELILIPISQTTIGFIKDAVYIIISSFFQTRILIQLRGSNFLTWYKGAKPVIQKFVRFTFRKADGVIVLGKKLRYIFEPFFKADQILVVPNGADFHIPEPQESVNGRLKIFYLANFRKSKGISDAIDALIEVDKTCKGKYEFSAMGNWAESAVKEYVESQVNKYDLPVTFISSDRSEEKMQFLANSDIFVFPPQMPEGHPWVIVESLASGLPIISTDQGAITESVECGVNGFVVDSSSPAEIAKHLVNLIDDEELRNRMSKESRRIYQQRYTENAMVENLRTAIRSIIDTEKN